MKILCTVDGSEFASWGVEALGVLFHQSVKEIVLLHVVDARQFKKDLKEDRTNKVETKKALAAMDSEARKVLNAFEERATLAMSQSATKPFMTIRSVLTHGPVAHTIIRQAEKRKPDVVVMGSRGLSDIKGYLLGSVSRKVLSHAPCAVLTVKRPFVSKVRVVIALDGSKASKRAANQLKAWTSPDHVSLHILAVVPEILTDLAPKVLPKARVKALTEPFHKLARELAAHYRQFFLQEGYEVDCDLLTGNPREVIVNYLDKKKADLAVLGSKGLTGSERFQIGSVSEWVAAYAPCSVLVMRPRMG